MDAWPDSSQVKLTRLFRGIGLRQIRLVSGLCCSPIWSAISSITRSAISRWSACGRDLCPHGVLAIPADQVFFASAWPMPLSVSGRCMNAGNPAGSGELLQLLLGLTVPALSSPISWACAWQTLYGPEIRYPQVLLAHLRFLAPHGGYGMVAGGADGVDAWLDRAVSLAPDASVLQARAPFLLRRGAAATLALLGFCQGGRTVVANDSAEWRWNLSPPGDRHDGPARNAGRRPSTISLICYLGLSGSSCWPEAHGRYTSAVAA